MHGSSFLALGGIAAPEHWAPAPAVARNNGPLYFGRIVALGTDYAFLRDVSCIRIRDVNQNSKQVASMQAMRGGEWHATHPLIVNQWPALLIEPARDDSQVAKLIAKKNKQVRQFFEWGDGQSSRVDDLTAAARAQPLMAGTTRSRSTPTAARQSAWDRRSGLQAVDLNIATPC